MKATLKDVIRKAFKSPSFLNQLLKDPDRALERADLELSPRNLRSLKRKLGQDYKLSGRDLFRFCVDLRNQQRDPPPPWNPRTFPQEIIRAKRGQR